MKIRTTLTTCLTALALLAAKTFRLSPALWLAVATPLAVGLFPCASQAATTLDPQNPNATFTQEGTQSLIPGPALTLTDQSLSDFVAFFAPDADAAPGTEIDVTATFQIRAHTPNNADAGNRVVINDGAMRSAIAACIIKNGQRGIGLLSLGAASDPASYPVFVAVDWGLPVTIRLRRTAVGDAELIEVNGMTPSPRAILVAALCPAFTRTFSSVEFGCRSIEAQCAVDYSAYRSELVAPIPVVSTSWSGIKSRPFPTDSIRN